MANTILSGLGDVVSKHNLATNGNFLVNQRNNFASATQCIVGDYVADAWQLTDYDIDYLQVVHSSGYITFTGKCQKEQYLVLTNDDISNIGMKGIDITADSSVTSAVSLNSNNMTQIAVSPRYYSESTETIYEHVGSTTPLRPRTEALKVVSSSLQSIDTGGSITVTMLQSGDFEFTIFNYREILGSYRNPPDTAAINYAEEIGRCSQYYNAVGDNKFNLATNGSFLINQRGDFDGAHSTCDTNDFICDSWYISSHNISSTFTVRHDQGRLWFVGSGVKGEGLTITNMNEDNIGSNKDFDANDNIDYITGSLKIKQASSGQGAIRVVVSPRYDSTETTTVFDKELTLYEGEDGQVSRILYTDLNNINTPGRITVYLEDDGEFNFVISDYTELVGQYHAPQSAYVGYDEELRRCKRYYQTGTIQSFLPVTNNVNSVEFFDSRKFYEWGVAQSSPSNLRVFGVAGHDDMLYVNLGSGGLHCFRIWGEGQLSYLYNMDHDYFGNIVHNNKGNYFALQDGHIDLLFVYNEDRWARLNRVNDSNGSGYVERQSNYTTNLVNKKLCHCPGLNSSTGYEGYLAVACGLSGWQCFYYSVTINDDVSGSDEDNYTYVFTHIYSGTEYEVNDVTACYDPYLDGGNGYFLLATTDGVKKVHLSGIQSPVLSDSVLDGIAIESIHYDPYSTYLFTASSNINYKICSFECSDTAIVGDIITENMSMTHYESVRHMTTHGKDTGLLYCVSYELYDQVDSNIISIISVSESGELTFIDGSTANNIDVGAPGMHIWNGYLFIGGVELDPSYESQFSQLSVYRLEYDNNTTIQQLNFDSDMASVPSLTANITNLQLYGIDQSATNPHLTYRDGDINVWNVNAASITNNQSILEIDHTNNSKDLSSINLTIEWEAEVTND